MATTPGSRPRGTRSGLSGDDTRDPLNPMQEPLGSMDRPMPATSDINEVNLPPGETVRRTGNLGTTNAPRASTTTTREGRSFTATFAIAAVVLLVAFLIALYLGNSGSNVATAPSATTTGDQTGSTTTAPIQQTAPGTGDAGNGTGGTTGGNTTGGTTGGTTAPANP